MKKLIAALFIFTAACSTAPAKTIPMVTATPFVIPILPIVTYQPTSTPIIVTPTPPAREQFYTVVEKDTLGEIAQRFGLPLDYLIDQNGIDRPNDIFPGETIVIPPWPEVSAPPSYDPIKIVVTLSTQTLDFYENGVLIRTMLVSTGTFRHPTPTGIWQICNKYRYVYMTDNETYWLPNVPWDMQICNSEHDVGDGYYLHGTYWHHNFGKPMSHGCVNLATPDAYWIYKHLEMDQEIIINE